MSTCYDDLIKQLSKFKFTIGMQSNLDIDQSCIDNNTKEDFVYFSVGSDEREMVTGSFQRDVGR